MTLDTSALVAVLFAEPGYLDLVDRMLEAETLRIGAPTLVEASLVYAGRTGRATGRDLRRLLDELAVTTVPFGEQEWQTAAGAFARYGRGRHKASLNFGDCLAYATAATVRDSLLFVGDDFRLTDIAPAMSAL